MNNLFDQGEKRLKFRRSTVESTRIKCVLDPCTQTWIEENLAQELKILCNGYYRNSYGGFIPLNIAVSKGLIQYDDADLSTNLEQFYIEYSSSDCPFLAQLSIKEVYHPIEGKMISVRSALDHGYLDLKKFRYKCNTLQSIPIHQAFFRGWILGELRTELKSTNESMIRSMEKNDVEFNEDHLYSSFSNIVNSLVEFRNSFQISDRCELTNDGFIRDKQTKNIYLLSQAMEFGWISIRDRATDDTSSLSESMLLRFAPSILHSSCR